MKRIMLTSGWSLSQLAQGYMRLNSWNFSPKEIISFIDQHIDLGITTVDHSPIYGDYSCEKLFGNALKTNPTLRQKIEIISKCGINLLSEKFPDRTVKHYDYSQQAIIKSCEQSLIDLQTDVIDLFLLHRPSPLIHFEEIIEAFNQLISSGKVRAIGVSNFLPLQLAALQKIAPFPLVTNQIQVSLNQITPLVDGTLDNLQSTKIAPMFWSPLGGGKLHSEKIRSQIHSLAAIYETSPEAIQIAWLLKLPNSPIPIVGSGNKKRIKNYVDGCSIDLAVEDWFKLYESALGYSVP